MIDATDHCLSLAGDFLNISWLKNRQVRQIAILIIVVQAVSNYELVGNVKRDEFRFPVDFLTPSLQPVSYTHLTLPTTPYV